jgi:hypothetical protein
MIGPYGPILLQDVSLIDKLAHFDRERIPERVVHAKVILRFAFCGIVLNASFCWLVGVHLHRVRVLMVTLK